MSSPDTPAPAPPEQPADGGQDRPRRPDDITRRAAVIATAVAVPVVVVLLVLVNVLGGSSDDDGTDDGGVAQLSGSRTPQRAEDLPTLDVDVPAVTPAADLACPVLMKQLPLELDGEQSRLVKSDSPYVYAWGDPAVVMVCGAEPPAGYVVGTSTIQIDQVQWFVDTSSMEDTTVWTTVDRNVPVQVRVPASADSASVTTLGKLIGTAIPYVDPTPGG